jgi:hypothetical protein
LQLNTGGSSMYRRVAILATLITTLSAIPAKSELLWSDICDVRQRMQTFIRKQLPAKCVWPPADPDLQRLCKKIKDDGLFGYQDVRKDSVRPSTIAIEIVVWVDQSCFNELHSNIRSLINSNANIISIRKAADIFSAFNADGGPTLIFYFPATPHDLEDLSHPIYD